MINKKYLKLLRSKSNTKKTNFIYEKVAERIIDSLDLVLVDFREILEIGINEDKIYNYLKTKYPNSNFTRSDIYKPKNINNLNFKFKKIEIDNEPLKLNSYNLVYSNLLLHLNLDFEKLLKNIYDSLKPNSLFIATIPHFDNIYQLVNSMYLTDLSIYGGAYQRVNPSVKIDKILKLLNNIKFDSPAVNVENINIEYSKFNNLLIDIKNTNQSYCYKDKKNNFENKNYFNKLEKIYKEKFYNGSYILDINFNIISAWKK